MILSLKYQKSYKLQLMSVYEYLYNKIITEMRMIYITQRMPKKIIKLDPIDPEDLKIDLSMASRWSENNKDLYDLLLNNGQAEFICNRQFLNEFYTHLQFMYCNIKTIDLRTLQLKKLKILNLFHNKIKSLQNIPEACRQLYLDFNHVDQINLNKNNGLQLLSISHNIITDSAFSDIVKRSPNLRCLNISYNRIEDIKNFVSNLKKIGKLKVLISRNNPISLLNLYWDYITTQVPLDFFDNQKYVKPEAIVQKAPEPIKQQKKEEKKDDKNAKKDTKKGTKAEQKPVQQEKKPEAKVEIPKVRTEQDFKEIRLKLQINVFQNFSGILYDPSIFPPQNLNLNIKKTQSTFWVAAELLNKQFSTENNKISFDTVLPDNQINRLAFQLTVNQVLQCSHENLTRIKEGLSVFVYKQEPVVETDPETGEQKVCLIDKKDIVMKKSCIGANFISLQPLASAKKKEILVNSNLYPLEAVRQPLFKKPFENENELISKNRIAFDTKLAAQQQARRKKQEEEQAGKAQKKGGKDSKKAPAKKQAKKDAKQVASDKKMVEKSTYPSDGQEYRYLGEQKMFKCLKEKVSIKIVIQ